MSNDGIDVSGIGVLQESGCPAQGSAGAGHVVYDDYGFIVEFIFRQGHFNLFVTPSFLMGNAIVETDFVGDSGDPLF